MTIDLVIGLLVPMLFMVCQIFSLANDKNSTFEFDLCDTLYEYEEAVTNPLEYGLSTKILKESVEQVLYANKAFLKAFPIAPHAMRDWAWGTLIVIVFAWIARTYCEARYGVTLGKWLLGIRTIRSTFRRCGFARSLLRSTIYCIDIPLFLTAIPAFVSLVRSPLRQRLGDRLADTVVIRAGSIIDV